jgi:NAD(P)-dependent dehydrogenase (short-subunit alcohol dehydrogenase family)
MPSEKFLQNRVALVTGASSGLGHAFAGALARAGASVFLVARREEKLREAVNEIVAAGGEASYHAADVRTIPALYDLIDVLLARYKKLHILINNAGLGWRAPLENLKRSEIGEMLETDLAAPIYLTQAALPALKRNAPSDIVNVASLAGLQGFAEGTGYCAAQHGLVGFSRALAQELEAEHVRVTTLCLGSVDTEFFDLFRPNTKRESMLDTEDAVRTLLHVLGSPPEVVHGEVLLRRSGVKNPQ